MYMARPRGNLHAGIPLCATSLVALPPLVHLMPLFALVSLVGGCPAGASTCPSRPTARTWHTWAWQCSPRSPRSCRHPPRRAQKQAARPRRLTPRPPQQQLPSRQGPSPTKHRAGRPRPRRSGRSTHSSRAGTATAAAAPLGPSPPPAASSGPRPARGRTQVWGGEALRVAAGVIPGACVHVAHATGVFVGRGCLFEGVIVGCAMIVGRCGWLVVGP
jgi:hypothetical protein